jgi:hypothetical protein
MLQDSIRSLKLDRRLRHRRGWVGEGELADALAELPDVKGKAAESAPPPAPAGEPASGS